ncbi:MAG: hypothetical protein JSS96_14280, partial [Bacteroidetes bacterium]|nr:hypothetical protein [Bacteroidota bacterium]
MTTNIQNLSGGRVYIIGHEGSGELNNAYPPDSWESVTRAIEYYNADGVEIDLQLSQDSVLFMFEGNSLETSTTCLGCLVSIDSLLLSKCIYQNTQTPGDLSTKYLTAFQHVIARFAQRKIKPVIFMDLHTSTGCITNGIEHAYYTNLVNAAKKILVAY